MPLSAPPPPPSCDPPLLPYLRDRLRWLVLLGRLALFQVDLLLHVVLAAWEDVAKEANGAAPRSSAGGGGGGSRQHCSSTRFSRSRSILYSSACPAPIRRRQDSRICFLAVSLSRCSVSPFTIVVSMMTIHIHPLALALTHPKPDPDKSGGFTARTPPCARTRSYPAETSSRDSRVVKRLLTTIFVNKSKLKSTAGD